MRIVEIELANTADLERYDRLFEDCPEAFIQQSSWWAECIAPIGPDRPIFLICEEDGIDLAGLPLYVFEAESGNILTSVPQPGPLGGVFCRPGLAEDRIDAAYRLLLGRALEIAERHNCMTLSVITNPFADDLARYEKHLEPDYWLENFTQYVPLAEPIRASHGHRNNLNRAKRAALTVKCAHDPIDLKKWYQVHRDRHIEIGATPLDFRLFESLFNTLVPRGKAHLILVLHGEEIASGGLYVQHKQVMDVFMLSMNGRFANFAPNFLNTEYSLSVAAEDGRSIYNWQSAPGRGGGVYDYKRQWGSVETPYYFLTKRLCPEGRLRAMGAERIRQEYPWHYVVPFGLFTSEPGTRRFFKS